MLYLYKKIIFIKIALKKTRVIINIEDNGSGFSSEKEKLLEEMKRKMIENDAPSEVLERFGF